MPINISKFEPNLPKFRNFWVNWELGGEFRRKKYEKSKPEEKSHEKIGSWWGSHFTEFNRGIFQMQPYFNTVTIENV